MIANSNPPVELADWPAADQAFDALTQALLDLRISVRLRPGQFIVIDNKRIVHSRSKFKANYDGEDRWLKRSLVRGK